MRAVWIVVFLAASASATGWAQSQPGHDMTRMEPATLAAHCAQMKQDMARGRNATTPDMQKMMAQCDELDRSAVAASRRR